MADSRLIPRVNTAGEEDEKGCRAEGRVEQREDCGVIRFQASVGASYYRAHFIRIHFQAL